MLSSEHAGLACSLVMEVQKKSYTFEEIKQKMVNYCVYQDRCHQEVEQKMRDFILIPEAKDEIFLYLIKERYLDEERFTRSYIRGKFNIKHWGRNKIKMHLKQKGISEKLIARCMDEIDEYEYEATAIALMQKQFGLIKSGNSYQKKSKVISFMLGKGYEYDIIQHLYAENRL